MSEVATLWRCTKCHRWSHAKRRPSNHKVAIVVDGEFGTDVIGYSRCGPFEKWVAIRYENQPVVDAMVSGSPI